MVVVGAAELGHDALDFAVMVLFWVGVGVGRGGHCSGGGAHCDCGGVTVSIDTFAGHDGFG